MVTTIMLKDDEDILLNKAKQAILERGLNSLDPALREEAKKANLERLTKGAVVALAAILLIYALENKR